MGGFGNILFQILAYNVLLKKEKRPLLFVKILTEENILTKLLKWTIHQNLFYDLIDDKKYHRPSMFYAFTITFFGMISKISNFKFRFSTFFNGDLDIADNKADNIFGYFQEKEFLERNRMEVMSLGKLLGTKYRSVETHELVVHYRKGDSNWATDDYYKKVKEHLLYETSKIIVVTDSLKDAADFFSDIKECKVVRSSNALDDFKIMLSAKKLYCAPSTFSWWAAHSLVKGANAIFPSLLNDKLGVYLDAKHYDVI